MNPDEVAIHEMQRDCVSMIVDLLAECVRQASEAPHVGRRPCVVMSRGLVNKGNPVVVVPLTSETRRASSYNIALPASEIVKDAGNNSSIVDSVALCSQVFMVDKRKLENKIGKLSYNAVLAVQLGLAYVFDIR